MRRSILPFLHLALTFTFCGLIPLKGLTPSEVQDYRALCQRATQEEYTYRYLRYHALHSKVVEPFLQSNVNSYRLQIDREVLIPKVFYEQLSNLDKKLRGPDNVQSSLSLSPLALRHAQIAIELEREFGSLKNLRILQVGSGFGQLAAHLAETRGFGSYTLLDWPECLCLQKKFLSSCGLSNITYLEPSQIQNLEEYDLVLCAFPFTEWGDATLRETLLQTMTVIPRGYITCHAPWHPSRPDNNIEDSILLTLARAGHRVFCAPERGDPSPIHSVIRWGEQDTTASDLPTPLASNVQGSAVVAEGLGYRLGDQLLCYAQSKWIAYHYHLPILVRPFPFIEGFALSKLYPAFSNSFRYAHEVHPKNHREMCDARSKPSTLFVIDTFSEPDFEYASYSFTGAYFYTNWRDREFLKSLREDFAPLVDLEEPLLDDSDVHLAVHLRLGGGFDDPLTLQSWRVFALKAPPHSFYLQQIQRVASLFPDKSVQVHFFTDDPDPKKLAEAYEKTINNPRLHFTYRTSQNRHDMHVLDDFFAMSAYDCLIHSRSHFSTMAAVLGDFAVRITPTHSIWNNTHWAVDQVECEMDGTHPLFR